MSMLWFAKIQLSAVNFWAKRGPQSTSNTLTESERSYCPSTRLMKATQSGVQSVDWWLPAVKKLELGYQAVKSQEEKTEFEEIRIEEGALSENKMNHIDNVEQIQWISDASEVLDLLTLQLTGCSKHVSLSMHAGPRPSSCPLLLILCLLEEAQSRYFDYVQIDL